VIYVNRYAGLIPQEVLDAAVEAQRQLKALPADQRAAFIKRKSSIWRAFKAYLSEMSYGKCWYSECPEVQSFLDVDHYRPKLEAKRSESECDPGYDWLAFSWENFRLAAQRSNRRSTNEETEATEGKGSWFPLLDGSPRASWGHRCECDELPMLLDPTVPRDVDLIDVNAEGRMVPSMTCVGSGRRRVERSIELYGLNLPKLTDARKRAMRDLIELHTTLMDNIAAGTDYPSAADALPISRLVSQIRRMTLPCSAYSKAARAQLRLLPGGASLCAQPEDIPILHQRSVIGDLRALPQGGAI
jgi:hypothetical protein